MNRKEVSAICWCIVCKTFGYDENEDVARTKWNRVIADFAKEASQGGYTEFYVVCTFQTLVNRKKQQGNKVDINYFWRQALQRHHDFYVCLYNLKKDNFSWGEQGNFRLAMERERAGLCEPLTF